MQNVREDIRFSFNVAFFFFFILFHFQISVRVNVRGGGGNRSHHSVGRGKLQAFYSSLHTAGGRA